MDNLHLIVGLGNPGVEYAKTRHNAGFLVADELARRWRVDWQAERKFDALLARQMDFGGRQIVLCKPQSYMNNSGEVVAPLASYYRVELARVMVVVDDADLELGCLRLRPQGSAGGHHGLESIEQHLGTREYPRLRVGIGRQGAVREITGHVLGRFSSGEQPALERLLVRATEQLECWLKQGLAAAMNKFNGTEPSPTKERTEQ
jgi:peptidyl-tRNA hydrolase, PTH1 family